MKILAIAALSGALAAGWYAYQRYGPTRRPLRVRATWRPVFDERNTYDTEG